MGSGEDREEEELGDNTDGSLGDGSSASGASTTGDEEYFLGGADRISGAAEDGGECRKATQCRGRRRGQKARMHRNRGPGQKSGNRDSASVATEHKKSDVDGTDEARRQCT